MITPTIGRIVLFKLAHWHVIAIRDQRERNTRFSAPGVIGNAVSSGDIYPMIITRVWGDGPDAMINGTVLLDGFDTFWATSVHVGDEPGDYQWMPYQVGQAAKTETLQAQLEAKFPRRAGDDGAFHD